MAGSRLFRSVLPAISTQERQDSHGIHPHLSDPREDDRRLPHCLRQAQRAQDIDGLLAWAAGSDENGLHVVTVWQSKAHQDRWAAEQLLPAFQALGMADVVSNSEFTECDADELYIR